MAIGMVCCQIKFAKNCSNVILAKTGQKADRVVVVQEGLISNDPMAQNMLLVANEMRSSITYPC